MKNSILIFSLLFVLNSGNAQVWVDDGAVWHYDYWNVAEEGYYEIKHIGDTLIEGELCKAFEGTRFSYGMVGPGEGYALFGESDLGTNYTYVSGDTVFYRNNDEFFVMLNFGAEVGDTWTISTFPYWEVCAEPSQLEVTETGSILIDGSEYRTITVQPTSNSPFGFVGTFVERFGNISGFDPFSTPFPTPFQCEDLDAIVDWDNVKFKCFEDNSFDRYNPSGETCDWWKVNVGISEDVIDNLLVYPNPFSDFTTIRFGEELTGKNELIVRDIQGKKVFQTENIVGNEYVLMNNGLDAGIYLLSIVQEDKLIYNTKLIVE